MSTVQIFTYVMSGIALAFSGLAVYYAVQAGKSARRAKAAWQRIERLRGGAS